MLEEVKKLFRRYLRSELSTRASALAFHTLLGIVPAVGLCFWYLKHIRLTDKYADHARTFIASQLNVSSSQVFSQYFDMLTAQVEGNSWGWVGLILFVYTVYNLIEKFGDSLDYILTSQVDHEVDISAKRLALLARRLFVMLLLPVALVCSVALSQWVRKDSALHFLFQLKMVGPYFAWPLAWITSVVAAFLVYYFVPKVRVPWKEALKAAFVVGPLSEIVRYGFGIYNSYAVSVHKIYGVLAVIPLFILWIQIAWTLLLGGALLIQVPHLRKRRSG